MAPSAADREARASPWEAWGWLMGAVWLVFLGFPIYATATADASVAARVVAFAAIAAFALVYLHGLITLPEEPERLTLTAVLHHVLMALLLGVVVVVIGADALGMLPFVVALAMFTLPVPATVAVLGACLAAPALAWLGPPGWDSLLYVILVGGVAVITGGVRFAQRLEEVSRRAESDYQIVSERERVARDVHDVLGHSLTVVTTKAELAERMLDIDPERTRAELAQIQSLTREALGEIRATVAGLRVARLGEELTSARIALSAAGIEADVPESTEAVDPRHRLVLAWVLREAVTNVVRHSQATRCAVTLGRHGIVVEDDGRGPSGLTEGNGLRGLRERVEATGGELGIAAGADGRGTRLEVAL